MLKVKFTNWFVLVVVPAVITTLSKVAATEGIKQRCINDADYFRSCAPALDEVDSTNLFDLMSLRLNESATANKAEKVARRETNKKKTLYI